MREILRTSETCVDHSSYLYIGTGIWCIDFADQHPGADVLGIDLSAIQPSWVSA